ncbi:hypothetical protein I3760_Q010400 [Carya illinoinensis]|nr:hypothetical protein I3760_Q010400 [Carya illinoinensis]
MNTNLVVLSLLLILSLLLSEAQGIRLDKKFMSRWQHKVHEDGSALVEKTNGGVGEVILCKDGHCISGKNRKLITTTTSPSTTIPTSKNEMNEENKAHDHPMPKGEPGNGKHHGEEENLVVNHGKTVTSDQHQEFAHHEHFPADIIDMAEMDYSPARRKPPIHN